MYLLKASRSRLITARTAKKLSITDVAKKVGIAATQYQAIERGTIRPRLGLVVKVLQAVDMTSVFFLTGLAEAPESNVMSIEHKASRASSTATKKAIVTQTPPRRLKVKFK